MNLKEYTVMICDACYNLEGQECHTPDCIFYLQGIDTIRQMLNVMLIRPIVDGESLKAQDGEPVGTCHELDALKAKVRGWGDDLEKLLRELTPLPDDHDDAVSNGTTRSKIYTLIDEMREVAG